MKSTKRDNNAKERQTERCRRQILSSVDLELAGLVDHCPPPDLIVLMFVIVGVHADAPPPGAPPPPASSLPPPPTSTGPGKNHNTTLTIIVVVVSSTIYTIMYIVCICIFLRKRRQRKSRLKDENVEEINIVESLQYNFDTISIATDNFSDVNKLGQGGFGAVYRVIDQIFTLEYDVSFVVK
ncbi:Cysteine-rich receptor-like protein kinase 25 [Camellia lanceoleosa]|uniref:Cysteine-rich receptor-like protein kinase 25 n=1 Tax=Camellia lanceoleosa TaxID=1840588 RepID=A0ACC0GL66_9ERIC|nr:Cysteine-rich receptor-like protein kinase 25 [Camellia lanceoleosa]